MFLDDSVAYGKSQAGASTTGLGGKKRIENPVNVFAWNSRAGIHDFDFDAAVVRAGSHFQDAAGRHGIARVEKKIQEHLLQLVGGATHRGQPVSEIFHYLNLRGLQRMREKFKRLLTISLARKVCFTIFSMIEWRGSLSGICLASIWM